MAINYKEKSFMEKAPDDLGSNANVAKFLLNNYLQLSLQ